MSDLMYEDDNFKIIQSSRDFVVIRKDFPYEFHSHFKRYSGARGLIRLFYKQIIPNEPYFYTAMERITTDAEFDSFYPQKEKQLYRNVNKGVNRKRGR